MRAPTNARNTRSKHVTKWNESRDKEEECKWRKKKSLKSQPEKRVKGTQTSGRVSLSVLKGCAEGGGGGEGGGAVGVVGGERASSSKSAGHSSKCSCFFASRALKS